MIDGMAIRTTDTTITRNDDGTHTLTIVSAAGRSPFRISIILEPHMVATAAFDDSSDMIDGYLNPLTSITLTLIGHIHPQDGRIYEVDFPNLDDCGRT